MGHGPRCVTILSCPDAFYGGDIDQLPLTRENMRYLSYPTFVLILCFLISPLAAEEEDLNTQLMRATELVGGQVAPMVRKALSPVIA